MPASLSPAFVLLNYHSEFAPHKQIVPTLNWFDETSSGGSGTFDSWTAGHIDADDMIKDLVNAMKDAYPTTITYDNYVIFTQADATANPVPVAAGTLAIDGTVVTPGWYKAVQGTFSWRTSAFGLSKLVLLDLASGDDFDKNNTVPGSGPLFNMNAEVTADAKGWSGQDNGQPMTFISVTKTLNEKLRRAYRMT